MVFRRKFTVRKITETPVEIIQEPQPILKQTENKTKSKLLNPTLSKDIPRLNNKSKVNILIPDKRKKKLTETMSEINLDTDDDN